MAVCFLSILPLILAAAEPCPFSIFLQSAIHCGTMVPTSLTLVPAGYIPTGKDYDLYVYNSSGSLLGSSTDTGTTQEFVSGITAIKGNAYYFAVKGKNGSYNSTSKYTVRSKVLMNPYAGFSQSSPANSATWFSTTNLDKLYSSGSSSSWLTRFKNAGCVIASYAMILRNLGATTSSSHYDFRSGSTGYLAADPFTVMLANTAWPTITANSNGIYTANTSQDPIYTYHSRIASSFGKTIRQVSLSGAVVELILLFLLRRLLRFLPHILHHLRPLCPPWMMKFRQNCPNLIQEML